MVGTRACQSSGAKGCEDQGKDSPRLNWSSPDLVQRPFCEVTGPFFMVGLETLKMSTINHGNMAPDLAPQCWQHPGVPRHLVILFVALQWLRSCEVISKSEGIGLGRWELANVGKAGSVSTGEYPFPP